MRFASPEPTPRSRLIAAPSCQPTVNIGSRARVGSCEMKAISWPRTLRERLLVRPCARSAPSHRMFPERTDEARREQAEDRVRGDALAAARFADEAHDRAGAHLERDAGDERGSVVDAEHEVADAERAGRQRLDRRIGRRDGRAGARGARSEADTDAAASGFGFFRRIATSGGGVAAPPASTSASAFAAMIVRARTAPVGTIIHGLLEDEARGGLDHAAPGRLGRLRAEADEGEAGLHHDADAEQQHELHDDGGRHVRQDVTEAGRHRPHAVDRGRLDEQLLLQRLRLAEEHPVQRAEEEQAEHRHDERHVRADRGDERRG